MLPSDLTCRACLQKSGESSSEQFFTEETGFQSLKIIYMEMTFLQVANNDPLPKCLCSNCSVLLKQFKSFKDTCIQSDLHLRKNLINVKEEIDDLIVDTTIFLPELKVETCASNTSDDDNEELIKSQRKPETESSEEEDEDSEEKSEFNASIKSEADKVEDIYKCPETDCERTFSSKSGLDGHKRVHDGDHMVNCQICDKALKNQKSLRKHLKTHVENDTDSDSDDEESKPRRKKSNNSGQEKYKFTFKCTYDGCRKAYKVKEFLDAHMRSHDGIPPNVCDICNKPLSSIRAMHRHRQIHETTEPGKYSCKQCHKECVNELALVNHMRKHEKGRTCVCDVCGLAFYTNSSLAVHKQSHNVEKLFKCQQCPRDFRTNMGLYKHVKKDHTTNSEVHVCRICDKRFPSKKFLYRHCEGTHTVYTTTENVYSCIQCDAKFKNKQTLRAHARLHTGERKYACPLCPKTFAHAAILKKHSYFHSGERPVHCEVCDKGFYQKCALDIHMNIHKRQWIAQGVQGITLYEYNRNKKNNHKQQPTNIHNDNVYQQTPEESSMGSHQSYDHHMLGGGMM